MTVEMARENYADWATFRTFVPCRRRPTCPTCNWIEQEIDAASIALDLAVAEESRQRTRESVAW